MNWDMFSVCNLSWFDFLVMFGIVFGIADSRLLQPFRSFLVSLNRPVTDEIYRFFTCYHCLGFWTGIAFYLWRNWQNKNIVDALYIGFASSMIIYVAGVILGILEKKLNPEPYE